MRGTNGDSRPVTDRRTFLRVTGAGVTATALAGCLDSITGGGDGTATGTPTETKPVVLGGLEPYSGPYAQTAREFVSGLEFALKDINADGGVLGRELVFEDRDTKLDPAEATTIATELIEAENAVALTGPISSDIGLAVAPIAEENEVPHVPQFVGSHEFLTRDSRYNFRMGLAPAPTNARAVAQMIENQGLQTVGAIIADYSYGHSWKKSMEAIFPDDLDLTMKVAPFRASSFTSYLREMPEDLELLITASHPPGVFTIYQQLQNLDSLNPDLVIGRSDAKLSIQALGQPITQGFLAQSHPDPFSTQYKEVAQRYYDETGAFMGTLVGVGYVVADLIAAAIEDAGEAEPTAVADAIRNISLDTLFGAPIQYTKWGELKNLVQIMIAFESGAPSYYPDGNIRFTEYFRTEPLPAYDPSSDLLG
ncbi:MAG: ABC transporter substrate-binding protein [Halobacteriales archaeon]